MGLIDANLGRHLINHPELAPVAMDAKAQVLAIHPDATLYHDTACSREEADERYQIHVGYEVLGAGRTPKDAWADALDSTMDDTDTVFIAIPMPSDDVIDVTLESLMYQAAALSRVPVAPTTAIDRFTAGLITWDQLIGECLDSERLEANPVRMTEKEQADKLDELDTLIAFLEEELEGNPDRKWQSEGARYRLQSLLRLRARRLMIALSF